MAAKTTFAQLLLVQLFLMREGENQDTYELLADALECPVEEVEAALDEMKDCQLESVLETVKAFLPVDESKLALACMQPMGGIH